MKAVNVRQLKNNPSDSLRMAKEEPVVVLNRDTPEGLLLSLDDPSLAGVGNVREVLATALFRDGALPLTRAARVAGMSLEAFMEHVSRRGISVIQEADPGLDRDLETLGKWLRADPSSSTPGR